MLLGVVAGVVLADNQNTDQTGVDLGECGSKYAEKLQALGGSFLDKDEIMDLGSFDIVGMTRNRECTILLLDRKLKVRTDKLLISRHFYSASKYIVCAYIEHF
jgi:hypothetical protein